MNIRLINVNGLTVQKQVEMNEMFFGEENDFNILCITETHHRWEKIHIDKN